MPRLIDADALFPGKILAVNIKNTMETVEDLMNRINNAPTVDAAPVVHGRWTTRTVANWLYEEACSVCGFCGCEEFNYRPNCGAKMDGDGNG